jgi:hypothetical protein
MSLTSHDLRDWTLKMRLARPRSKEILTSEDKTADLDLRS